MAKADLTAQRLRKLLEYNSETGVFRRLVSIRGGALAGDEAGGVNSRLGYVQIGVDGVRFYAHRLAWLYTYGEWPAHQIDHINGVRSDNRLANLRDVTQQANIQNRTVTKSNTGFLGVHWVPRARKWCAQVRVNGVRHYLGLHATPEAAATAYAEAKQALVNHRSPS